MKKSIFLLVIGFLFTKFTSAQHCPFDGSTAVVVQLLDANKQPLHDTKYQVVLQEIDNPVAEFCDYNSGLQRLMAGSLNDSLVNKYPNSWTTWANRNLNDAPILNDSTLYTVVLGQTTYSCLIKRAYDYAYIERYYEIQVLENGKTIKSQRLFTKDKYHLCTNSGSWNRIQPIKISVSN